MKFNKFSSDFKLMKQENFWSRIFLLGTIIVVAILALSLANKKPVVTLVPPNMNEEAQLHHDKAQEAIHKAWSLYLAESLGNVSPSTADFTRVSLDPLLSPEIRTEALVILDRQIEKIKSDQVSYSYEPREVQAAKDSNMVYVVGRHYTHAAAGESNRVNRTYEFEWEFENYLPKLVHIDTYKGAPRL